MNIERQRALVGHEKKILHLEGKCEASQATVDPEEGFRTNIDAQLHVLALRAAGGDRGALKE